jgi:putative SOS response-associated peptidase YedK
MSREHPPTNVPAPGYATQITTKPSWRTAYKKRRCVIQAAGYYEWQPVEEEGPKGTRVVKQPYYVPAEGDLLSFAGLYEWWPDPLGYERVRRRGQRGRRAWSVPLSRPSGG